MDYAQFTSVQNGALRGGKDQEQRQLFELVMTMATTRILYYARIQDIPSAIIVSFFDTFVQADRSANESCSYYWCDPFSVIVCWVIFVVVRNAYIDLG